MILRGVILKGAGLESYGRDVAFLVLYATVVMGVAYARLDPEGGLTCTPSSRSC